MWWVIGIVVVLLVALAFIAPRFNPRRSRDPNRSAESQQNIDIAMMQQQQQRTREQRL